VSVVRAGSLIDWSEDETRAYVSVYSAEQILNWRVGRVGGRMVPVMVALREVGAQLATADRREPGRGVQSSRFKVQGRTAAGNGQVRVSSPSFVKSTSEGRPRQLQSEN